MDTSWAGLMHPWSRKVAFVLSPYTKYARKWAHKWIMPWRSRPAWRAQGSTPPPRTPRAPLNRRCIHSPRPPAHSVLDSDIQELSEQIHRLLLQVRVDGRAWGDRKGAEQASGHLSHSHSPCLSLCTAPAHGPLWVGRAFLWPSPQPWLLQ